MPIAMSKDGFIVGICFSHFLSGLPGFCHLLRVVGNSAPQKSLSGQPEGDFSFIV